MATSPASNLMAAAVGGRVCVPCINYNCIDDSFAQFPRRKFNENRLFVPLCGLDCISVFGRYDGIDQGCRDFFSGLNVNQSDTESVWGRGVNLAHTIEPGKSDLR